MKAEALRKETQSLKAQVQSLKAEFGKMKLTIQQMEPPYLRENIEASLTVVAESSLEFLSEEYDDFGEFRRHEQREIQRLNNRVLEIRSKGETVGKAIEELEDYSLGLVLLNLLRIQALRQLPMETQPKIDRGLLFETFRRSFNS